MRREMTRRGPFYVLVNKRFVRPFSRGSLTPVSTRKGRAKSGRGLATFGGPSQVLSQPHCSSNTKRSTTTARDIVILPDIFSRYKNVFFVWYTAR